MGLGEMENRGPNIKSNPKIRPKINKIKIMFDKMNKVIHFH